MRALFLLIASFLPLTAQISESIIQGKWPPQTTLIFRDGSNNQQYICTALSKQPSYAWSGASMITSIADSATTATITFASAHGLAVGNRIYIAGMTSAGTSALNSNFIVQTVGSTTTLTITTSGVTDGTYTPSTDPAMIITTTAPRTSAAQWQLLKMFYTTTYLDRQAWAEGDSQPDKICDNRATYAYN